MTKKGEMCLRNVRIGVAVIENTWACGTGVDGITGT